MSRLSLSFLLFEVNKRSEVSVKLSFPPISTPAAIAMPITKGIYFLLEAIMRLNLQ